MVTLQKQKNMKASTLAISN